MTMRTIALLIAVALAVPLHADKKPKADKSCLAVSVGSKQALSSKGNNDDEREFEGGVAAFSATKVLDIQFAIIFSPTVAAQFSNAHNVELRLYTPSGNLYQSISIPITNDPKRAGERHRVPGYPDLVPVQVLQSINHGGGRGMFATVTLPVAGTSIVSNSLYGRWTASALVEDEIAPCAQPTAFVVNQ
jgi:hypothetical protein